MTYYTPPPTPRGWQSQAQRNIENARLAEAEEAARKAAREAAKEPAPPDPPPPEEAAADVPPPTGEGDQPQAGGGAPSDEPDLESPEQPPVPLHHAPHGPPPPAEEEPEDPEAERIRIMRAWIDEHWDTVEAMALAGETPERPAPPPPPKPERPLPPVHVAPGDRWNKPKMADFLRQLAATHSVAAAARAVGMSRQSAYKLRARLKGQPFDIAWEAAFRHGYDNLAHGALELALEGAEVPHYYQGKLVGTHRKHNEQLIGQLLRMRNRMGAPMLGRYGAAAEFWSENWDTIVHRVETGSVTWEDERAELGEAELASLELPDAKQEIRRIIVRNLPDEPPKGRGGG